MTSYTPAQQQAIYKYRENHKDDIKAKQAGYSRKHYLLNRELRLNNMKLKREFLRLARLYGI